MNFIFRILRLMFLYIKDYILLTPIFKNIIYLIYFYIKFDKNYFYWKLL